MWQTAAVVVVVVERWCRVLVFFGAMMSPMISLHIATPQEGIYLRRPDSPANGDSSGTQGLGDSGTQQSFQRPVCFTETIVPPPLVFGEDKPACIFAKPRGPMRPLEAQGRPSRLTCQSLSRLISDGALHRKQTVPTFAVCDRSRLQCRSQNWLWCPRDDACTIWPCLAGAKASRYLPSLHAVCH